MDAKLRVTLFKMEKKKKRGLGLVEAAQSHAAGLARWEAGWTSVLTSFLAQHLCAGHNLNNCTWHPCK